MDRAGLLSVVIRASIPEQIMDAVDQYVKDLPPPPEPVLYKYRPKNITPLDDIATALEEIQSAVEAHYDADNPAAVVDRLQVMEGYMATSGKLLADAKYQHRQQVEVGVLRAVEKLTGQTIHASTINKYIEALARDAAYLVDWCERLNRGCTHACEFARTIISKLKEEYRVAQYSGQAGNNTGNGGR